MYDNHSGHADRPHRLVCCTAEDEEEQEKRFAFFTRQSSQLTTDDEVVDFHHAQQLVKSHLQQARFAVTYQDEQDELSLARNAFLIQDRIQYLNSIVVPASKIRIIRQGALDTIHV
jgi:2-succinyl-5-enolpyruvyl-6-hydroxy-3-cyclohexene-1-carboxylate synthase